MGRNERGVVIVMDGGMSERVCGGFGDIIRRKGWTGGLREG